MLRGSYGQSIHQNIPTKLTECFGGYTTKINPCNNVRLINEYLIHVICESPKTLDKMYGWTLGDADEMDERGYRIQPGAGRHVVQKNLMTRPRDQACSH